MSTIDAHTLAAAHVLNALDDADRAVAEEHLATCEACAAEAARHSHAAERLAWLVAETPPARLRDSVFDAVSVTRQLPPVVGPAVAGPDPDRVADRDPHRRPERSREPEQGRQPEPGPGRQPEAEPGPPESAQPWSPTRPARPVGSGRARRPSGRAGQAGHRERSSSRTVRTFAAVAAAALIAAGVVGGVAVDQRRQIQDARTQAAQARSLAVAALDTAGATALRGGGTLRTAGDAGMAVVSVRGLPPLRDGRTYQLWLVSAASPRSAGLVEGQASSATWVLDDTRDARTVALTIEPHGGSPMPTTQPLGTTSLPG